MKTSSSIQQPSNVKFEFDTESQMVGGNALVVTTRGGPLDHLSSLDQIIILIELEKKEIFNSLPESLRHSRGV